jgi:hypothetical protein
MILKSLDRVLVRAMLDLALLQSVARQLMSASEAGSAGLRVSKTGQQRLRTTTFTMDGREYQAIEQNATKPSRWGQLARDGHEVVQFKDVQTNKYVAVAVDGEITEYGRE